MAVEVIADETCAALGQVVQSLDRAAVHRFLVGVDRGPVKLDDADATELLGDPLATLLLLNGVFPRTGTELVEALREAAGDGDPLAQHATFVLGEGGHILFSESASLQRGLRFIVAIGEQSKPDIIVSTPGPDEALIEAMAWDRAAGGFNYYRTVRGAWVFAGNSRDALIGPTEGKGPFESHVSGNLVMKELRRPWINWHSVVGLIFDTIFAPADQLPRHPWFAGKQGADIFETTVARPSIRRWNTARFATRAEPARRVLKQVVESTTVNLICSPTESRLAVSAGDPVRLPQTFFVDSEALTEVLDLPAPPGVAVDGRVYRSTLERFEFRLRGSGGYSRPGDTRFAFVVPERAFEDRVAIEAAVKSGLISRRLVACLLMVDFPNPVFSARRASLLAHAADVPDAEFSQATADAILAAAEGSPDGSAEREFAARWDAGDEWRDAFSTLLSAYYDTLRAHAATQAGFDDYTRLAESRRARVRDMPIFENPLLFAATNLPPQQLEMRPDGTVREVT